MIDIQQLTSLISSFRAETEKSASKREQFELAQELPSVSRFCKESISPEPLARRPTGRQTVGSLLQAFADLLATATSKTEYNVLRFWKETISQFQLLYDIQQRNVSDHSNVILALWMERKRHYGFESTNNS